MPWIRTLFPTLCCLLALIATVTTVTAESVVTCFGDSLTAGYGLDESQAWPALLGQAHPTWRVINAGVSGDTTTAGLQRIAWALKAKPNYVLIALGANDGLRGQDPELIESNLRTLVERVRAAKAIPVLIGLQLPTNLGADYRQRFAAIFPRIATDLKVPLIPFLLVGVAGNPQLNLADGVHPNAAGQKIIADTVSTSLQRLCTP